MMQLAAPSLLLSCDTHQSPMQANHLCCCCYCCPSHWSYCLCLRPFDPRPPPNLLPLSPACDLLSLACDLHRLSTRTHSSCCCCGCFRLRSDRAASTPSTLAG